MSKEQVPGNATLICIHKVLINLKDFVHSYHKYSHNVAEVEMAGLCSSSNESILHPSVKILQLTNVDLNYSFNNDK